MVSLFSMGVLGLSVSGPGPVRSLKSGLGGQISRRKLCTRKVKGCTGGFSNLEKVPELVLKAETVGSMVKLKLPVKE